MNTEQQQQQSVDNKSLCSDWAEDQKLHSCVCDPPQVCLKNTLRDRHKATTNQTSLDAPLKPLENKDLMLIYTLGPKPTTKHVCVWRRCWAVNFLRICGCPQSTLLQWELETKWVGSHLQPRHRRWGKMAPGSERRSDLQTTFNHNWRQNSGGQDDESGSIEHGTELLFCHHKAPLMIWDAPCWLPF